MREDGGREMSKKNNPETRRNQQEFDKRRTKDVFVVTHDVSMQFARDVRLTSRRYMRSLFELYSAIKLNVVRFFFYLHILFLSLCPLRRT